MEEKVMNMLEQLYVEVKGMKAEMSDMRSDMSGMKSEISGMKSELTTANKRLDNIEVDIKALKQGQERIENKLDNMEAQNANRHVELNGKIDSLSKDITFVEAIAGKNTADIANLKLVK